MLSKSDSVSPIAIIQGYLRALESNDLNEILSFFSEGAEIISPNYGRMEVKEFYTKLCLDTASVFIKIRNINQTIGDSDCAFAHFDYTWKLTDGTIKELEILDEFKIDQGKIQKLRIFADGKK